MMNLSHSRMSTWPDADNPHSTGCARKYLYSYVFGVPQAPEPAGIVGIAFHYALQVDGERKLEGKGDLSLGELIGLGYQKLGDELARADPGRTLEGVRANMATRMETMIGIYHRHVQQFYKPTQAPELAFEIKDVAGVLFRGVIDAKGKEIIDWKQVKEIIKNAGKPWAREWIDDPEHTDQATAYMMADQTAQSVQFIVIAVHPDTPHVGTLKRYVIKRDADREERYKERIKRTALEMTTAEITGRYDATVGNLCPWCPYVGQCLGGQAWMDANGKEAQKPAISQVTNCPTCDGVAEAVEYLLTPAPRVRVRCLDCGTVEEVAPIKRQKHG